MITNVVFSYVYWPLLVSSLVKDLFKSFYQTFIGLVMLTLQFFTILYFSQSVAHIHCVVFLTIFKTVLIFLSKFSLLLVFSSLTMIFWGVVFGFLYWGLYLSKPVFLHKTLKWPFFTSIFFCPIFIFYPYESPITCQSIWYCSIGP